MSAIFFARLAAMALAVGIAAGPARAQDWPARPIKIVSSLAAGGGSDLLVRTVGDELFKNVGQPVVIENRPGGGGTLAASMVARAAPDGYTLLLGTPQQLYIAPLMNKNTPYDPLVDFTPITSMVEAPFCLAVHKSLPVNSLGEFIAYAKANPGRLSFGTSGAHSGHHFAGEYLKSAAGIDMIHVPYRGGNPAMTDLLSGQIPVLVATLATALQYVEGGNIKVLATFEAKRSRTWPHIPTIGETIPGFAMPVSWVGLVGPAAMPQDLVRKVHTEFVKATTEPKVRTALEKSGVEVVTSNAPEELGAVIKDGLNRYRKIAADAQLKSE